MVLKSKHLIIEYLKPTNIFVYETNTIHHIFGINFKMLVVTLKNMEEFYEINIYTRTIKRITT